MAGAVEGEQQQRARYKGRRQTMTNPVLSGCFVVERAVGEDGRVKVTQSADPGGNPAPLKSSKARCEGDNNAPCMHHALCTRLDALQPVSPGPDSTRLGALPRHSIVFYGQS